MNDDEKNDKPKLDHEPPAGAETTDTWTGGATPLDYTASAKWLVLRKKEKPAAEIFSFSYVAAGGDDDRPVTFVFNGGPGASSAYLNMGAVGPKRVDFPPDGSLPEMPPRLVQNEASWLAFSDRSRLARPTPRAESGLTRGRSCGHSRCTGRPRS